MKNKILALFLISGFAMISAVDLAPEQQARLDDLLKTSKTVGQCIAFRILEQSFKIADTSDLTDAMNSFFEQKIENMKCPDLDNIEKMMISFEKEVQDFCAQNNIAQQELSELMKKRADQENLLFQNELEQYLNSRLNS